jgi:hypothetical protein
MGLRFEITYREFMPSKPWLLRELRYTVTDRKFLFFHRREEAWREVGTYPTREDAEAEMQAMVAGERKQQPAYYDEHGNLDNF